MAGKFLVASKNRLTANLIQTALKANGHQIIIAPNGVAVVDLALDHKPNAIFIGVALTGLNGIETARALRALALTENVPIIFLAENADEAHKVADSRLPLTECLTAPYDLTEVRAHAVAGAETGAHVSGLRVSKAENSWMLAMLDPLTRLYHRRYLLHTLAYEAKRSARYKAPLAVFLVDVDNLAEINQRHSILTGDSVLIELGQLLLKLMRDCEIVGRNDVQDFLIIAPQTTERGVREIAQRICKCVAEHHFVLEKLDLHITVSVGFAACENAELTENLALLGRAEMALSHAKKSGKNRVEGG